MILAIMQPYLFPYLGYFQLIHAADRFLVHDDVQYIKGGWINRNRILDRGRDLLFTLPLRAGHASDRINQRFFASSFTEDRARFLRMLRGHYARAPFLMPTLDLAERALDFDAARDIAWNITRSLRAVCDHLGIPTPFELSSRLEKDDTLHGEARVLELNRRLGSTHYINPMGGVSLYHRDAFQAAGLRLSFLHPRLEPYPQMGEAFVPGLSILDVLMFNPPERIRAMLDAYDLVEGA